MGEGLRLGTPPPPPLSTGDRPPVPTHTPELSSQDPPWGGAHLPAPGIDRAPPRIQGPELLRCASSPPHTGPPVSSVRHGWMISEGPPSLDTPPFMDIWSPAPAAGSLGSTRGSARGRPAGGAQASLTRGLFPETEEVGFRRTLEAES